MKDNNDSKLYLVDSVKVAYMSKNFSKSPLIVIDGKPFKCHGSKKAVQKNPSLIGKKAIFVE
ncbi:hypothetical protein [Flavobacterium sp. ZB4P13]|uniref:hypothetical protein n=1 Tax=Flavobacterium sp. ZB4P13 TaxID=3401728 RepID=UPI003AB04EE8